MIFVETMGVSGFECAIRSMRNPLNSWDKSDSYACDTQYCTNCLDASICDGSQFHIGKNDLALCKKLIKAGPDHRKFLRMIHAQFNITAPLYLYKEMDVYKVATVSNSCSTMHTIHKKEFHISDFSHDKLNDNEGAVTALNYTISVLNYLRAKYIDSKDKTYWYQIIQLLPSSYKQLRTYDMNYETLMNIYNQRKNHKLDEWKDFCKWIETLPCMMYFLSSDNNQ